MTRRTKLSATFLSVLLALAAIGAVAAPVSAGGSDGTEIRNPCEYTVTIGEVNGMLEDSSFAGPGLPSITIDERTVMDENRIVETDGASVTIETIRATMENVTTENDSTPSGFVGDGQLHLRDVTITGPGLPDATIESETFVLRNETFSADGNDDGDTADDADSIYTVDELRVSIENVVVRNTSEECAASTDGDKSKPQDDDSAEKQKSDENATSADGHDKSDEKETDGEMTETTTETADTSEETTETTETTDGATSTQTANSDDGDPSSSESADAQANAERTETDGPGFGVVLALIALLAATLLAVRRR